MQETGWDDRDVKDGMGRSRVAGRYGTIARCRMRWGDREVQYRMGQSIVRFRTGWDDREVQDRMGRSRGAGRNGTTVLY